ncbi:hypothetical protein EYF80_039985 [Liparis tanakae]|uniref:Uncharacterized protein n=1 Tax=Liparis tanakae TaxID=230148 RepID=A0A4Z2G956_9TELE|nr:hypothetical protein EYF80_039985 [Liparis tanakae]
MEEREGGTSFRVGLDLRSVIAPDSGGVGVQRRTRHTLPLFLTALTPAGPEEEEEEEEEEEDRMHPDALGSHRRCAYSGCGDADNNKQIGKRVHLDKVHTPTWKMEPD